MARGSGGHGHVVLSWDLCPMLISSMHRTDFIVGEKNTGGLSVNQGSEKKQVGSVKILQCDGLEMLWFDFRFLKIFALNLEEQKNLNQNSL